MTATAWKRALRELERSGCVILSDGCTVSKHYGAYGIEYSLDAKSGDCVTVEWDLRKIAALVVD